MPHDYSYRSYIKDIFIEVPNYKYRHHPNFGNEDNSHNFIGRDKLQNRFLDILKKGSKNGAYLVTGYRGMGKTSLVNIVVEKYKKEESNKKPSVKISNLKISLAQSNLDESDVLRHILKLLYEEIKIDRRSAFFPYLEYYSYFLSIIFLVLITGFTPWKIFSNEILSIWEGKSIQNIAAVITLSAFLLIFLHNSIKIIFEILINVLSKAFKHLQREDDISIKQEPIENIDGSKIKEKKEGVRIVNYYTLLLFIVDLIIINIPLLIIPYLPSLNIPHLTNLNKPYLPDLFFPYLAYLITLTPKLYILGLPTFIYVVSLSNFYLKRKYRQGQDNQSKLPQGITYRLLRFFYRSFKLYELDKQITLLYDRSTATITKSAGTPSILKDVINTLTGNQVHTFPIVSAKEIEYELIDILGKYDLKKFIFIFDELDKVEMDIDNPMMSNGVTNESDRTFLNDLRERKQVIIKVFSSMKHLLTEAKARFIFIAGREMFDASLADISDRQSALGSIFHSIFYVESFLKGIRSSNKATKSNNLNQIEAYIGNLLFHNPEKSKEGLSLYADLWEHLHKIGNESNMNERIKIMFCMQNYVTYLTYRSNGSPKKLIRLFEENMLSHVSIGIDDHVIPSKENSHYYYSDNTKIIVFSEQTPYNPKDSRLFINFSFKQQYKFGFNAYLFLPFLITKKNYLNNLSDGINVSTPYLMDNIIKFHPFAFSNHNLELLPELLSSNKAPELRNFIQDLIDYLEKNHIRVIDSGLFRYKFMDRIHNEVAYISRVYDEESAAFNFSQDENHAIKVHLLHKIKFIRNTFKNFKKHRIASVESLTFLNDLLGDSYLFDEAYKDAIVSLVDSIHDIYPDPKGENGEMAIESFLLWMRIKLKISMIFDKMKYYEMAIGNLGAAMEHSVKYLSKIKETETDNPEDQLTNGKIPHYKELLQVTQQAILASIYVQEKFGESVTYAKLETFLKQYLKIHHYAQANNYVGRDMMTASFFANLGILLYYKNKTLPYRTSLIVKDKVIKGKRSSGAALSKSEQDSIIEDLSKEILLTPFFSMKGTEFDFSRFISPSFQELYTAFDYESRDFRFSLITYICYKKALSSYLAISTRNDTSHELGLPILIKEALHLLKDFRNVHDTRKLVLLADSISRIGDMLFSLSNCEKYKDYDVLVDVIKTFNSAGPESSSYDDSLDTAFFNNLAKNDKLTSIDYPISLFYLAGKLYIKASKNALGSFQYKKILLSILRSRIHTYTSAEKFDDLIKFLKNTILKKILKLSSASSAGSDRLQISSMKHYLNINESTLPSDRKIDFYSQLATSADAKEALIIMAEILLKAYEVSNRYHDFDQAVAQMPELNLLKQTNSISLQSLRIMELSLQVQINTFLLTNTISKKLITGISVGNSGRIIFLAPPPNKHNLSILTWQEDLYPFTIQNYISADPEKSPQLFQNYIKTLANTVNPKRIKLFKDYTKLISNSIFCLHQAILTADIYGHNYMQSNAYLGSFHMKMGIWLKHLILCHKIKGEIHDENSEMKKIINQMDEDIKNLVGVISLRNIDNSLSQFQIALEYFENSIQLHSEGPVYKSHLNTMIFLEDDYGDTYNHFGAALERQAINSGKIRKNIIYLKTQLAHSSLFSYDSFVNNSEEKN